MNHPSILPVIDLLNGVAVHAIAGERERYEPVQSRGAKSSRALHVAQCLRARFEFDQLYVADLDAILRQAPNLSDWKDIASVGYRRLWIDCGVASLAQAKQWTAAAADLACETRWIVGLETLADPAELSQLCSAAGPDAVFSLDLKQGRPLTRIEAWRDHSPLELVAHAVGAGFANMILLDLAQVGARRGPGTVDLCRAVHERYPHLTLCSGGGVRTESDVQRLVDAGCQHVLVATALHCSAGRQRWARRVTP